MHQKTAPDHLCPLFHSISWIRRLSLAAAGLLCVGPAVMAAPVINEFLTNNNTGLVDEDLARGDWIEIYNPDAEAIDLNGWSLTDDALVPAKWIFPAVSLAPQSYLVVFASGKNRQVVGANLHTNFGLSSGGEYLALISPIGVVAHEYAPTFPNQSR
jgi:hypothetical protein